MRAIRHDEFGGPEVLRLVEVPRPEPIPTEVLIRVHAAAINPVDIGACAGGFGAQATGAPPSLLGWDVSGVVEEVGYGVTRFAPGDEVFGMPRFPHPAGTWAEYVTAPSRHLAKKPASLTHPEAAALALAGLTAWQGLIDTAHLQAGQRVLVQAAAGGVGHLAVQIAKAHGAYVIGTARAEHHEWLRTIGLDEAIDYTTADFASVATDIDVVMDLVPGDDNRRTLATLRSGGVLVNIGGAIDDALAAAAAERGVRLAPLLVEPDYAGLEHLARLAASGALKPQVGTVLPLAEAASAFALMERGNRRGKIVLDPTV